MTNIASDWLTKKHGCDWLEQGEAVDTTKASKVDSRGEPVRPVKWTHAVRGLTS